METAHNERLGQSELAKYMHDKSLATGKVD